MTTMENITICNDGLTVSAVYPARWNRYATGVQVWDNHANQALAHLSIDDARELAQALLDAVEAHEPTKEA